MSEEQKQTPQLEPCPYCGAPATVQHGTSRVKVLPKPGAPAIRHVMTGLCQTCRAQGPHAILDTHAQALQQQEAQDVMGRAISLWNSRASKADLGEVDQQILDAGGHLLGAFRDPMRSRYVVCFQAATGRLAIGEGKSIKDAILEAMSIVMSEAIRDIPPGSSIH